jgi:hypothetical protein
MSCSVCYRNKDLTKLTSNLLIGQKPVDLVLCPKHLAHFNMGQLGLNDIQKKIEEKVYCCGVPIKNGRCQISGKL